MPAIINRTMTSLEWALLVALSVLWGGSFFFTGVAVKALPPFTIVVLRVGLAAVILNCVVYATGQRMPVAGRTWGAFLCMGLLNNVVPFSLIVWGQTQIAGGVASILNATTPLFAVVVAHALTRDEKMTSNRLAGVLTGLLGVVVMIGPSAAIAGIGDSHTAAQCAVLGAAFSYSLAGIYGRRFKAMGIAPIVTATGQVTASTLVLIPVALLIDRPWMLPAPGPEVWAALLGIAALSTALAYILYFRILATAGATNLMLVTFLIPISAIFLGALVLGEQLRAVHFVGMALIGLGLAAIDGRLFRFALPKVRQPMNTVAATRRGDADFFDEGGGI